MYVNLVPDNFDIGLNGIRITNELRVKAMVQNKVWLDNLLATYQKKIFMDRIEKWELGSYVHEHIRNRSHGLCLAPHYRRCGTLSFRKKAAESNNLYSQLQAMHREQQSKQAYQANDIPIIRKQKESCSFMNAIMLLQFCFKLDSILNHEIASREPHSGVRAYETSTPTATSPPNSPAMLPSTPTNFSYPSTITPDTTIPNSNTELITNPFNPEYTSSPAQRMIIFQRTGGLIKN